MGEAVEVFGFDQQTARDVVLAVSEAVSNIISHCYRGRCDPITLRCLLHADRLEIRVRDFGPKPDPATLKGRDLADIRPGGLGIHIMRQTMDEVEYDLSMASGTELRMVKFRAGKPPETC
jgi:anti-sigma regulatory factor (Ser/Thr protein kinase)